MALISSTLGLTLWMMSFVMSSTMANGESSHIQEFSMQHSYVHSMVLWWNITEEVDLGEVVIRHSKVADGQFTTYSSPQFNYTQELAITDLVSDTPYKVCITITLVNGAACTLEQCERCLDMSTIPVIRDDSIIAVILVLGAILLLVLIGFLCWKYAKKQKERLEEEDDDSVSEDESKQPILHLSVPSSNGPRRSVDFEDRDIPYITPPVEELRRQDARPNAASVGTVV